MNFEEIIEKVEIIAMELCKNDTTGHDFYHAKRVYNLALKLQEQEGGNKLVIGISALLHDVHRIMSNEQGKHVSPKESLGTVRTILDKLDLDDDTINNIIHCIEFHDEYIFREGAIVVKDIESLIIQDADNLDALGAIGIARNGMFSGHYNIPMWIPDKDFDFVSLHKHTDLSMIHYFYNTIMKLKDNMNTKYGREIAEVRHEFTFKFFEEFFLEWNGEK